MKIYSLKTPAFLPAGFFILIFAALSPFNLSSASDLPLFYKTNSGAVQSAAVVTGLDSTGKPVAPTYKGPDGQWHPSTVVIQICGTNPDGTPLACPPPAQLPSNVLTASDVNVNSGVAGLNGSGNVTAPLSTSQVAVVGTYASPSGNSVSFPVAQFDNSKTTYIALGQESIAFGGFYDAAGDAIHRSLSISGQPYGSYNAGCVLCVFSSNDGFAGSGSQAALSGLDYRNGASAIANGDLATATVYTGTLNHRVRFSAQAAAFSANGVTLATPMTDAQMARMHVGMYVATNIDDTARTVSTSSGLPSDIRYRGVVQSWDATHIYVYGWASIGGSPAAGQVPNISNLDTAINTDTVPLVFVGVGGGNEALNEYVGIDPTTIYGKNATDFATSFLHNEYDVRVTNGSASTPVSTNGFVYSEQCVTAKGAACPAGSLVSSAAFLVNGPDLQDGFISQVGWGASEFRGYNVLFPGNGPADPTVGVQKVMGGFRAYGNGTGNTVAAVISEETHSTTFGDWRDDEIRYGAYVDPTMTSTTHGFTPNNPMAVMAFNHLVSGETQPRFGGVCLLGYGQNEGLCENGDGSVTLAQTTTVKAGLRAQFIGTTGGATFSTIANTAHNTGDIQWCTDCVGVNSTSPGMYIVLNGSNWSDLNRQPVASGPNAAGPTLASLKANQVVGGQYSTINSSQTLTAIMNSPHATGDQVWCNDCRNAGQAAGAGTGRWIFLDHASTWRSQDGVEAVN